MSKFLLRTEGLPSSQQQGKPLGADHILHMRGGLMLCHGTGPAVPIVQVTGLLQPGLLSLLPALFCLQPCSCRR